MARTRKPTRSITLSLALLVVAGLAGCTAIIERPPPEEPPPVTTIHPFLMFVGQAEEALNYYVSLFPDAEVLSLERFGPGEAGPPGTVRLARFRLLEQEVMCFDSPPVHDFGFTPSFSFFVTCTSLEEHERLFAALSKGGQVAMPPDDYGFSQRFAWTTDRFGVSWQLNLPR